MRAEQILLHIVGKLEAEAIPYMLVGSFATNLYGIVRSTVDADIVLQTTSQHLGSLIKVFGPEFDCDPQFQFETVTGTLKIVLRDRTSDFIVELFLLSQDPHDQERFLRRQMFSVFGQDMWFLSREDVLVTKLRWLQLINRKKDRIDIEGVIAVQGDAIDWPYVESWCDRHGSRALLEQIRNELRER